MADSKIDFMAMDGDGYVPVTLGASTVASSQITDDSVVQADLGASKLTNYQETFAYSDMTDGGAAVGTFDLSTSVPAGAVFVKSVVTAITGFAGDTSATFTIGDGTDVDRYNTGTPSCFTTAAQGVDMGAVSGTAWHTAAKTPKVTVTTNADFTSVSAGQMTVTLYWYEPA